MKIFLEKALPSCEQFHIENEYWSHYLTSVRRMRKGDELEVVGRDSVAGVEIVSLDPLGVKVLSTRERQKAGYSLWLLQAITRKKKFEEVVKIGSELGVTDFMPLISEYTVRRPNKPEKQRERWRKIALDSTRIAGRDWVPKIHLPVDFYDYEQQLPPLDKIYWGDVTGKTPDKLFTREEKNVAFIIGPEGDFSKKEKADLIPRTTPVSLGKDYYRSETAALALTTLWLYR